MAAPVTDSLRTGSYWRWSASAQFARLREAMAPLAFTLLATATTGSYRLGGVMVAVSSAAELAGAVPCGRLLDRIGPARGVRLALAGAAAGLGGLAGAATLGAPDPVLLALVLLPGLVGGGIAGGFRALLTGAVAPSVLPRAVAIDMTVVEGVLIVGPLVASVTALVAPVLPILVMAVACVLSIALVPRLAVAHQEPVPETGSRLRLGAAAGWLAAVYAIGHLLSTIEVAPVPLVHRLGAATVTAPIVPTVLCLASITGGVLYTWRGHALRPSRRAQACCLLGMFVVGALIVLATRSWTGLLTGTALVGVATAPLGAVASTELERVLPAGRRSEGFSFAVVAQASGFTIGSLTVGALSTTTSILLGTATVVAAIAVLAARNPVSPT